jgi:hypothetical protein
MKRIDSNQIERSTSVSDQMVQPIWSFTGVGVRNKDRIKNESVANEVLERLKYFKKSFKIWKDYK